MNIIIADTAIRHIDNLYNLNDLHKASGGEERHRPNQWLRTQQAQDLIEELKAAQICAAKENQEVIQVKNGVGTFVCKELVYAYAMWISAAFNLKVIRTFDRVASQPFSLPDFTNPAEAARAWADKVEEVQKLAHERDEAIRTKAHISAGREASIMGRLGNAVKENARLKRDLGYSRDYKQVKAIVWLGEYFNLNHPAAYSQIGKTLNKISTETALAPIVIEDSRFGKVNAYHADVIELLRVRLEKDDILLAKYRGVMV